jgi:hypothetical protein
MSKNAPTMEQLKIACRHVLELIDAGMTENLAIRSLEIYANVYAKYRVLGAATPDHADQYELWSKAARKAKAANPNRPYGQYLRVEHGTRRHFARLVLNAFKKRKLAEAWMNRHCDKRWKVAVITHAEDERLSKGGRSILLKTPDSRWAAANIKF